MAGILLIVTFFTSLLIAGIAFCKLGTSTNDIQEAVRLLKTLVEAIN